MREPIAIQVGTGVESADVIDALDQALLHVGIVAMRLQKRERVAPDVIRSALAEAGQARQLVQQFADA